MNELIMKCFVAIFDAAGDMKTYKDAVTKLDSTDITVIDNNGGQAFTSPITGISGVKINENVGVAKELEITFGSEQVLLQPMEDNDEYIVWYEAELLKFYDKLRTEMAPPLNQPSS